MNILVSPEWLAAQGSAPDLHILDASYFPLDPARDPAADFAAGHIPGACFLDLEHLADTVHPQPGMIPPLSVFAHRMMALGIAPDHRIILYDDTPHRTAARAWWMFRMFGADKVAILDGGLPKWQAEGRPIETGITREPADHPAFVARDDTAVRTLDQIKANLATHSEQLVDARGAARFTGAEADPRGLAPGHIPGSLNLPYTKMLAPDGTFRPLPDLRAAFDEAGVDLARPLVATCGSGVTAAVVLFAAALLGKTDTALYDGSWSEYGADASAPKAIGPA